MHPEAQALLTRLRLTPHPEGGYYRETHRSAQRVTTDRGTMRAASSAIYFLVTGESFSAFHRLGCDETWHFYRGDPLTLEIIDPSGRHQVRTLGVDDALQTTVPAGSSFAAHVEGPDRWALVGCDCAPGFEFADFRLVTRAMLTAAYPQFGPLIARYTR